jgi:hypothetical protein
VTDYVAMTEARGGATAAGEPFMLPSLRIQIKEWLPEAMLYFKDPSRPLPSTLAEVRDAVVKHSTSSALAPIGVRPVRVSGP